MMCVLFLLGESIVERNISTSHRHILAKQAVKSIFQLIHLWPCLTQGMLYKILNPTDFFYWIRLRQRWLPKIFIWQDNFSKWISLIHMLAVRGRFDSNVDRLINQRPILKNFIGGFSHDYNLKVDWTGSSANFCNGDCHSDFVPLP